MSIRMPKTEYDVVALAGGMDQVTPTLSLKPGVCRDALNYECAPTGGYSRIGGYERFDGLKAPSTATYSLVQVVSFTNTPTVGQTLTGNSSGATGHIVALGANYLVLTQVTGTFTTVEVVKVSTTTIGTATPTTVTLTAKQGAQYTASAADVYRALISKVPGSGATRGVVGLNVAGTDKVFAFRDNVGGTSTDLYVASGASWVKIPYIHEVSFTAGGTAVPADGATLTQGGVTSVVRRVMASSGSTTWAGSTAGRFVIDVPTGGSFAAGAATLTGGATVTLSGADTQIAVLPGGKYEFFVGNVTGSFSTLRAYGADGVNRMFEFDGTTYCPIPTGASPDTPKHIVVHKNHLMPSIDSSFLFSAPGFAYRYLSVDGGGEIAVGDVVTGFLIQPGAQTTGALTVYGQSNTFMLYGTGLADWNFVTYNTGTGALDYTAQNMAQSYALSHLGIISLTTTLAYGNFVQSTLTDNIRPFIIAERANVAYSSLLRERSQYRLFFSDGYGLYTTIVNGKMLGSMPVYFPNKVNCVWNGVNSSGAEISYMGDTSGYVHQMDVGSSFDGASIDAYITLNWNAMRSPRVLKRFRHSSVEMQGSYYAEFDFGYQLGYGTSEINQSVAVSYVSGFSPPIAWDTFTWDSFTWDGRTLFPTEVDVNGTAENLQVTISSTGNFIYPYTVNSIINHFTPRRGLR